METKIFRKGFVIGKDLSCARGHIGKKQPKIEERESLRSN